MENYQNTNIEKAIVDQWGAYITNPINLLKRIETLHGNVSVENHRSDGSKGESESSVYLFEKESAGYGGDIIEIVPFNQNPGKYRIWLLNDMIEDSEKIETRQELKSSVIKVFEKPLDLFEYTNKKIKKHLQDEAKSNGNRKLFEILKPLSGVFPNLEFTNIDAKGKTDNRCVWVFEKGKERFGNVLMEIWDKRKNENVIHIVIQKKLLQKSDEAYVKRDAKVFSRYRITLWYPYSSETDLKEYVKRKLQNKRDNGNGGKYPDEKNKRDKDSEGNMFDLNTILYGPPGTGKTYHTVCYAVAICEGKRIEDVTAEAKNDYSSVKERFDQLKNNGRIEFTTFHQSYGYEEFIEGIRPVMNDLEENKSVEYEIADGIFKSFCDKNGKGLDSREVFENAWNELISTVDENNPKCVFTWRTGKKKEATYLNDDRFRVKWSGGSYNDLTKTAVFDQWSDTTAVRDRFKGGNKWLFDARQAIIDEMKKYGLPEYDYKTTQPSVFIIDEINRGNISKIFGELITLIEPSKRLARTEELRAILPYSKKPFGVPDNVYIIGTMNTADRSIATIDTALRRRFAFKEMLPDAKILRDIVIDGINIENMLESMNNKISVLFDREHTIGHAYFMPLKNDSTITALAGIFKNNVIPLLQEYFYEDYEKIRLVLGDNKKHDESLQFVKAIHNDYSALFGGDIDLDISYRYEINEAAFQRPEAYKSI